MSEVKPVPSLKVGEVLIRGRLVGRTRRNGGGFNNLVVMPAPDPYSSPSTVEIGSQNSLGERDEDISVICRVGGYKRQYDTTDRETGERKRVHTADNRLTAVE